MGKFSYTEDYILKEKTHRDSDSESSDLPVSANLEENLQKITELLHTDLSGDVIIRKFKVNINKKQTDAFIFFVDGLVDRMNVGLFVLDPLMHAQGEKSGLEAEAYIREKLISQNAVSVSKAYRDAIDKVCFGECGLFVDGIGVCFSADVKGWEKRGVSKPSTEGSVLGPQEGFTELIRANTAMLRKAVKDPELIVKSVEVGRKSKTPCAVIYLKSVANPGLVEEVLSRLSRVDADYLFASEELENFLEESNLKLMPQILATERPDRTAMELCDGNVAVLVNGSPFALIMPATFFSFMKTTDNSYMRLPYANLLSVVRYIALILSVLLPGRRRKEKLLSVSKEKRTERQES